MKSRMTHYKTTYERSLQMSHTKLKVDNSKSIWSQTFSPFEYV